MKTIFSLLLVALLAVAVLSGCTKQMENMAEDVKDGANQAVDGVKDTADKVVDSAKDMGKDAVDKSKFIGEEEAKKKALERAGLSAEEVKFERVELDYDDGVWQYEVDFQKDRTEYDVDVKADDGKILKYETETDDK